MLDKALRAVATRYSTPDRSERWIASISIDRGFSIIRTTREELPNGEIGYRLDRDRPPVSYFVGITFDDWELDWNGEVLH